MFFEHLPGNNDEHKNNNNNERAQIGKLAR